MITVKILREGRREGGKIKQITFQETNFTGFLELAGGLCTEFSLSGCLKLMLGIILIMQKK